MRWLERLSFQSKITLVTLTMIFLAVLVGWGGIHFSILPAMESKVQSDAWHIAESLVRSIRETQAQDHDQAVLTRLGSFCSLMPNLAFVELLDARGRSFQWWGDARYRKREHTGVLHRSVEGVLEMSRLGRETIYEVKMDLGQSSPGRIRSIRVGLSNDYIRRLRWHLFYVLSVVALLMLALGFICTRWFTAMITEPVNKLLRMTQLLSRGRLQEVLDEYSEAPPCRPESYGETFRRDAEVPCSRWLFERQVSVPGKDDEFPYETCRTCDIYRHIGSDELLRLLMAFRFMAIELRQSRDKLKQRYEFEERLLEACPDGIIANDRHARIILYNSGAERLLGYSRAEALRDLKVYQLYPADEAREIKRALLSEEFGGPGVLVDYNTNVRRQDGRVTPIRLSATLLSDRDDEFAVVGYFHDLTELHEHMRALSEANDRLNKTNCELARMNRYYLDMLSFVTHELKSPIANGYMSANALRQEIFGSLAPDQAIMVEAVCRNLDQCMEMIRHYLDLSRIEKDELPVKPKATRILEEVVQPVLTALATSIEDNGGKVEVDVPADLEWRLDPELFRGVLTNLVSNALKYGEKKGLIRIKGRNLGPRCRLEVWNSGPGVSEADADKLFQKFQRLPAARQSSLRGTGLGLFITKTVVERHGGRIWVESEEGAWANFIIELPREVEGESSSAEQGRNGE